MLSAWLESVCSKLCALYPASSAPASTISRHESGSFLQAGCAVSQRHDCSPRCKRNASVVMIHWLVFLIWRYGLWITGRIEIILMVKLWFLAFYWYKLKGGGAF